MAQVRMKVLFGRGMSAGLAIFLSVMLNLAYGHCEKIKEAAMKPAPDKPVSLRKGQKVSLYNVQVLFNRMILDSRCPEDMDCEWPGTWIGEFTLSWEDQHRTIWGAVVGDSYMTADKDGVEVVRDWIRDGKYARKPLEIFGHTFEITQVQPRRPRRGETIREEAYKVDVSLLPVGPTTCLPE